MQGTVLGLTYSSFADSYFPTHNKLEVVAFVCVPLADWGQGGEGHWRQRQEEGR